MADANYKHLEIFVKLGTHSEPRRGEMSHIYDISLLRVKDKHCPVQFYSGSYISITASRQTFDTLFKSLDARVKELTFKGYGMCRIPPEPISGDI